MDYEAVIGLEVHAQLLTKSKMFCGCSAEYTSAAPNTHVCPICLGMPGVLPSINRQALEYSIMTGLALNCSVSEHTRFDRKNYPYPDLMKGYQISQYDNPLCRDGWLTIEVNGESKRIGITRVHQEEDVAKLLHRTDQSGETYSLVDVNRAGVPLMEIVGEPDLRSPEEARQYLVKLRSILQYLGVSTGNMEEGSFRCDANVSIRPAGSNEFMAKVEVKNMNSFKSVYNALDYEAKRQRTVLEEGGQPVQETRGWVEDRGVTVSQRSKEYAHDYRYFPEPDLPPLAMSRELVEEIQARLPELPDTRCDRFMSQYELSLYDANLLTASRAQADYFETCVGLYPEDTRTGKRAKTIANWILGEFARLLNATGTEIGDSRVSPQHVAEMINLIDNGKLSTNMAKTVFEEMFNSGKQAQDIVKEKGLAQISADNELVQILNATLTADPQLAADYLSGRKPQARNRIFGNVMSATGGAANPDVVNRLLDEEKLKYSRNKDSEGNNVA